MYPCPLCSPLSRRNVLRNSSSSTSTTRAFETHVRALQLGTVFAFLTSAMTPQRVASLGVVCAAVHLWSVHAFAPAGGLSHSAVHPAAQNEHHPRARGVATKTGRLGTTSSGRRIRTTMSGGHHDLYVVGAGYLG